MSDEEEEEAQPAHAPRVAQLHARLPDPHRVQMQEDVRQHDQDAVAIACSGRPCRNTDVQTCVSVSQFQNRVPGPSFGAMVFVSAM